MLIPMILRVEKLHREASGRRAAGLGLDAQGNTIPLNGRVANRRARLMRGIAFFSEEFSDAQNSWPHGPDRPRFPFKCVPDPSSKKMRRPVQILSILGRLVSL